MDELGMTGHVIRRKGARSLSNTNASPPSVMYSTSVVKADMFLVPLPSRTSILVPFMPWIMTTSMTISSHMDMAAILKQELMLSRLA